MNENAFPLASVFHTLPPPLPGGKRPVSGFRIPADNSSCPGNSKNHYFQLIQFSIKMPFFKPPAAGLFDAHRGPRGRSHRRQPVARIKSSKFKILPVDKPLASPGFLLLFREKFPQATSTQRHSTPQIFLPYQAFPGEGHLNTGSVLVG
ncbi:MAG: hypothetical protein ACTFAL_15170 [Candidatus Electronema sp. V4]|uniref:hypothetical protein n=1 Tax=Candidatus Electronema sp. V4 TaxID=3454756 RepID=UPI00405586D1